MISNRGLSFVNPYKDKPAVPPDFAALDCVLVIAFFDNVKYYVVE